MADLNDGFADSASATASGGGSTPRGKRCRTETHHGQREHDALNDGCMCSAAHNCAHAHSCAAYRYGHCRYGPCAPYGGAPRGIIEQLLAERDTLRQTNGDLEQQNGVLTRTKAELQQQHAKLKQKTHKVQRTHDELQRHNAELERTMGELEQQNRNLATEGEQRMLRKSDLSDQISQLVEETDELEQRNSALERTKLQLEQRNSALERTQLELEQRNSALERTQLELERQHNNLVPNEADHLVDDIAQLLEEKAALERKVDECERRVLGQHNDIGALQAEKAELQRFLAEATTTADHLARDAMGFRAAMNRVDELTAFVDCCLGLLGQRMWCLRAEAWKGTFFETPIDPPSGTDPLLETFLHVTEHVIKPIGSFAMGALDTFKKLASDRAAGDNPKLPAAPSKELRALLPYAIARRLCFMESAAEAEATRTLPTTVLARQLVITFGGESSPLWRTELRDLPDIPVSTSFINGVLACVEGAEPDWQEAGRKYFVSMERLEDFERRADVPTICDEQEIAVLLALARRDESQLRDALRQHDTHRLVPMREVRNDWKRTLSAFQSSQLFTNGAGFQLGQLCDVLCRARCLVQHLIDTDPKPKRVVTMDGHGRFVIAFLIMMWRAVADGELTSDYVDALEIQLVDVLSASIESHKALFFTERFIHTEANILDVAAQHHKDPSVLFYFNFCGLKSGCKDNLQQVRQWLTVAEVPFMVSMASTRCAQRTVMGFQSLVNNLPDRWASIEVGATQRKKTVQTWFMTPRVPPPHGARLDALDESSGLD